MSFQRKKEAAGAEKIPLVRLSLWPAWISSALLAFLVIFTTMDVALRYLFNAPVYGGLEISESTMVALVMLAMAYCGATDGHVRVDVLDGILPPLGQRISVVLTGFVSLVVLWFLVKRTCYKVIDTYQYGDVTNFLQMPLWPLYALIALGMAAYGLVVLVQMLQALTGIQYERD